VSVLGGDVLVFVVVERDGVICPLVKSEWAGVKQAPHELEFVLEGYAFHALDNPCIISDCVSIVSHQLFTPVGYDTLHS